MNNFLREADFEIHRASDKLHKRSNVEIKTFLVGFSIKVKYNIALYQMHMFNYKMSPVTWRYARRIGKKVPRKWRREKG
jgi:hypothetical protein